MSTKCLSGGPSLVVISIRRDLTPSPSSIQSQSLLPTTPYIEQKPCGCQGEPTPTERRRTCGEVAKTIIIIYTAIGDWQPSAVGSKAFSCSVKIESVLIMIPRHLFHSNFSDSLPLWIAFPLCFMHFWRAGASRVGRGWISGNRGLEGPPCPRHTVSGRTREGTDPLPYLGHPSNLTLVFLAFCQGQLPVSLSLHALGSAGRRGSRETVLQWRRADALWTALFWGNPPSLYTHCSNYVMAPQERHGSPSYFLTVFLFLRNWGKVEKAPLLLPWICNWETNTGISIQKCAAQAHL